MKKVFSYIIITVLLVSCQTNAPKQVDTADPAMQGGLAEKMKAVEEGAAPQFEAFEKVYQEYAEAAEANNAEKAKSLEPQLEKLLPLIRLHRIHCFASWYMEPLSPIWR
jgi:hypothetical protein